MKSKITLALAAMTISGMASAQTWEHDTARAGTGYLNNVYYSLENGIATEVTGDNWHLGLSTSRFSEAIITNSADKGVRLYEISNDATKFGTDLTTALLDSIASHPMSFYNSNISWYKGAFNFGSADYGWATYDAGTHWLKGEIVFGLITGTDTLQVFVEEKQTTPANASPVFVIKTAKIDGTNPQTYTKNVSASAGRNFTYMNILDGTSVEREPLSEDWDIVLTNYNDAGALMGNTQYKVFGILSNEGVEVARVDTPEAEYENLDYATYDYDTAINALGRAWKTAGQGGTFANDSMTYFIKVLNGDVWQIVFTEHRSASDATDPGLVAFKKRKVYAAPVDTGTSVRNINANIEVYAVAPNPSFGNTNIVLDAKADLGMTQVTITDINGRAIRSFNKNINAGFQQISLDFSNVAAGVYIIRLNGENVNTATKFVKQ